MPGVSNYTTMMLSPDGQALYVGAREMLLALNTRAFSPGPQHQQLIWHAEEEKKQQCIFKGKDPQRDCHNYIKVLLQLNETHLYTCGTSAFSPTCTYISLPAFQLQRDPSGQLLLEDGKGRCPFDPEYRSTAIMVDGELYTGTVSKFQGNEPTIFRSLGSRPPIKTESSLNWLQEPFFVGSAFLQESSSPEDEDGKIYFFFSETGKEFDFFEDTVVSRVARVCKGDLGGERVLQRRWTTFLKAQLLCSHPEDGFLFNVLQDMFVLTSGDGWPETVFYGVFTSQWDRKGPGAAAVCAFSVSDVKEAFDDGLYKEVNRETQQWYTDVHPVPEPRPGAMPDRVLNYLKDHFLMNSAVRSQALLVQPRSRYQQLSVQRVQSLQQTYDVLFLGTDDGRLHKAVITRRGVRIIEEIQLFPPEQPVLELLLDSTQGLVYAASYDALAQVPVANCSLYRSCGECVLAGDPYCAWSRGACQLFISSPWPLQSVTWVQDIEGAETSQLCQTSGVELGHSEGEQAPCQQVVLQPNVVMPLPCPLLSNLASRHWVQNGAALSSAVLVLPKGELLLVGSPAEVGRYECWSHEGSFQQLMASYCVSVEPGLWAKLVPAQDPLKTLSTSRSISGENVSGLLEGRTYWTEFLVMCGLFSVAVTLLILFTLHKHQVSLKVCLKQGRCGWSQPRILQDREILPAENMPPLSGLNVPGALADHKGYQALCESLVVSMPGHESLAGPPVAFLESDRRPLNISKTFVEVLGPAQRPRVRLGSEIQDSVV
ncbi:semaphorin-4B isoform X2 [Thamnophis elegans]|uniref:semaphorin-4B isoform X2 n=1 Tax=Thamnophis elegans TaxID=35005 RepID=UPI001377ADC5|nr:semaphorin-4B isoform X2 [Thamnophis elegans]